MDIKFLPYFVPLSMYPPPLCTCSLRESANDRMRMTVRLQCLKYLSTGVQLDYSKRRQRSSVRYLPFIRITSQINFLNEEINKRIDK